MRAIFALVGVGSAVAAATPPHNTGAPTISGTTRHGETLTADSGTWAGTQPITFALQWLRCDSGGASCARIIGATGKTYALGSADVGNTVRARVRAPNNSTGASTVTSAASNVVAGRRCSRSRSTRTPRS